MQVPGEDNEGDRDLFQSLLNIVGALDMDKGLFISPVDHATTSGIR